MSGSPHRSTPQLDHRDAGPSVQVTVEHSGLKKGPRGWAAGRVEDPVRQGWGPPVGVSSDPRQHDRAWAPGLWIFKAASDARARSPCDEAGLSRLVKASPEPGRVAHTRHLVFTRASELKKQKTGGPASFPWALGGQASAPSGLSPQCPPKPAAQQSRALLQPSRPPTADQLSQGPGVQDSEPAGRQGSSDKLRQLRLPRRRVGKAALPQRVGRRPAGGTRAGPVKLGFLPVRESLVVLGKAREKMFMWSNKFFHEPQKPHRFAANKPTSVGD